MNINFAVLAQYWPAIGRGFLMTVFCWVVSVVLGMGLGFVIAVLQQYGSAARGPSIGLDLSALQAGILGLTIYGSAYFAEVFRGGFAAVPKGQVEAAEFLGMSRLDVVWRVKLPQMLVIITPSLLNLIIILSKETAILSIVTVPELTAVMVQIGNEQFAYLETTLVLCVAYLVLVAVTERLGRWAEARSCRYLAR